LGKNLKYKICHEILELEYPAHEVWVRHCSLPAAPRTKSYLCIERGTELTRRFVLCRSAQMTPGTRTCGRSTARRSASRCCRWTCSTGPASAPPSTDATASSTPPRRCTTTRYVPSPPARLNLIPEVDYSRTASFRPPAVLAGGDHRAHHRRDAERRRGRRRRRRAARRAVLHHRHHVHEPAPRPRRAPWRIQLERPRVLQEHQGNKIRFFFTPRFVCGIRT
jgi:hypothetical protein